jgi:hypothetical protein
MGEADGRPAPPFYERVRDWIVEASLMSASVNGLCAVPGAASLAP